MTQKHILIIVKAYLSDKNGKSVEKNVDALVVCSLLYWPKWGGGQEFGERAQELYKHALTFY